MLYVMSRAITTHELSTRTSMPAILPTRQDVPNIAVSSSQPVISHVASQSSLLAPNQASAFDAALRLLAP
jgi:hypothetical protein